MYNNPYFNQQTNIERINNQIADLERIRNQLQQPTPSINQTFQLAPPRDVMRFANSMQEVQKDVVVGDTPYFSKDMSVVWIKNVKGEIKTYELNEIIPKDDKDLRIEYLQAQIEELKKGIRKNESTTVIDGSINESTESEEPTNIPTISKSTKKSKQSTRNIESINE